MSEPTGAAHVLEPWPPTPWNAGGCYHAGSLYENQLFEEHRFYSEPQVQMANMACPFTRLLHVLTRLLVRLQSEDGTLCTLVLPQLLSGHRQLLLFPSSAQSPMCVRCACSGHFPAHCTTLCESE
jgi:hypothetical protein